jgi:hypothetical protein
MNYMVEKIKKDIKMNKLKVNHKITITITNLSDENNWTDGERYELDMIHLDESEEKIDNKYRIIYNKSKLIRKIINFLELKYNKL